MSPAEIIGLAAFIVTLVVHSVIVAYWGGGMRSDLRTVAQEITTFRSWKHDEITPWAQRVEVRLATLEYDDRKGQGSIDASRTR